MLFYWCFQTDSYLRSNRGQIVVKCFGRFDNEMFSKNIGADDSECLHNDDLFENDNDVDGDVY